MRRTALSILALTFLSQLQLVASPAWSAQAINDRIISEHVRMRIPMEREYLARDVISDLENCWIFINRTTGERMPRKVLVDIKWDERDSRVEAAEARILIGMDHPAAAANMQGFILRNAARELARMGLLSLSRGGAMREESEFLMEGMSEILAHEYFRTTRRLAGAWILAQLLDRMNLLGLSIQRPWLSFSGGRHDLRAAAPGITFLLTCRELYGRDKVLKLFEALRRGSLEESIAAAFKTSASPLEGTWLKKVREYRLVEDPIAENEDEGPRLERTVFVPGAIRAGITLQMKFFIRLGTNALLPEGLYVQDEASGRVLQGQNPPEKDAKYSLVEMPIEPARRPGSYNFRLVALDEGGNVRSWSGTYVVER